MVKNELYHTPIGSAKILKDISLKVNFEFAYKLVRDYGL